MSQKYEKIKTLLKELFQLDQPDLDFGLYRVMHAKSAEVTQFLDKDLLPQVKAAFSQYKTADKAEIEKELGKAIEQAQALGADPETLPKVKELRERLKNDAVDVSALESEVYDHLFSFFRRYYSEGDFLAKRVYKQGVYAIPYEGEEVTLHWANKDQYYIKTSEYLRDYAFRLRPEDDKKPMRVHFRLTDAAEGEHDNVKAAEGKDRVFILVVPGESGHDFIAEEDVEQDKELVINFEYRPATLTDWPDDDRTGKTKPPAQKELIALAVKRVLFDSVGQGVGKTIAPWIAELSKPHVTASGEKADYTRLEAHIKRYTARNTFDYFIHKDLGGFLRRELDFYIKNEVMHLDDVESETAPRVEQYLSKIKVIRRVAAKIIDFLAQLEDFQKKLWLKKKFVVETQYCITIGLIPETFYAEIAANEAQHAEWVKLFVIDEIKGDMVTPGYSKKLKPEFLKINPTLVVDTRHFNVDFTERLLQAIGDIDEQTDGVLFHSENFQALSFMQARYREQVKCIYIDPPFNTGDDFLYKDSFQTSSWFSLIYDRVVSGRSFMNHSGSFYLHLDDNANYLGRHILNNAFSNSKKIVEIIINTNSTKDEESDLFGYKSFGYGFVLKHQTIYQVLFNDSMQNKLWKPNRNTTQLQIGWLDLISKQNKQAPEKISDYDFFIEKWDSGKLVLAKIDTNNEKLFAISDLWNDIFSFTQSEMRVSESLSFTSSQKPENLLRRIIQTSTNVGDYVMDYFGGIGTTAAVSIKLNRKAITVEMGDHFQTTYKDGQVTKLGLLGRIKNVLHGDQKFTIEDNKLRRPHLSKDINWTGGGIVKYICLESYEDTLNNLEIRRTDTQQLLLASAAAQGADGLNEQYILRYMLNVETRGSQSLLNVQAFTDPTAYKLKVKCSGSDESREVNVDLMETFNWLIGLTVKHIAAPQIFSAAFERDSEKRLRLKDRVKQIPTNTALPKGGSEVGASWWFRTISGTTPDGRRTLIIWRKLNNDPEQDNLVLDEWFTRQGYSAKDSEFDLIYVNGGNNLENLKTPDDLWKVRLIEEDFHRLMFEMEGA